MCQGVRHPAALDMWWNSWIVSSVKARPVGATPNHSPLRVPVSSARTPARPGAPMISRIVTFASGRRRKLKPSDQRLYMASRPGSWPGARADILPVGRDRVVDQIGGYVRQTARYKRFYFAMRSFSLRVPLTRIALVCAMLYLLADDVKVRADAASLKLIVGMWHHHRQRICMASI